MTRPPWTRALAMVAVAASCGVARGQPAPEPRSLTIVVGSTAGGGYDVYARVLARHMGRHLPGQPGIVVQNMPGASSLKAVQYLDTAAPRDGSVLVAFNPGLITESLLNPDKIRLRFSDVAWIGSITRDLRVCYAWSATGIATWNDLKAVKRFNLGAPAPGTSSFINAAMLKNLFGIAVRQVTGYAGSSEQRLAIERGELDGDCGAWNIVPPDWIAGSKVNPLVKLTAGPVPGLAADVPFIGDLADSREIKGLLDLLIAPDALGRPFIASKYAPPERIAIIGRAFGRTMTDAAFLAEMERLDLPVDGPIGARQAEKLLALIYAAPPALVARAREVVGR
jgi:tripartite-type tricarboxylate transporter receptor subunit TctC